MGLAYTSVYCLGLMSYFSENFGFSANETVALMGVHTMGRAATNNSGFEKLVNSCGGQVVAFDLAENDQTFHHDSKKLSLALRHILQENLLR